MNLLLSFYQTAGLNQSFSDIDLWNATAQGDREAFGQLFRRHYSILYQFGLKICQDKALLEDTIQELFTELWFKKSDQPVHSVKAYLLQALKFKLYKQYRKQVRTHTLGDEEAFELGHDTLLIRSEENRELNLKITAALNALPPRQKEVIYLKIYKGFEYEEVGHIMQLNYQVVRNLLCQALKHFRKLVQEQEA
jgi:RNA polymerase sigma factor (sigma-70 family)